MSPAEASPLRGFRRISAGAGVALVAESAVLIAILVAAHRPELLPVTATFSGEGGQASGDPVRVTLAQIDVGAAVVVLCLIVAAARLLAVLPPVYDRLTAGLAAGRHIPRWTEFSLTSSITVFLVAQLNGVTDVGALVLIYAATSGMALFSALQERTTVLTGHPKLALCFGAALGIVPWGVIAFQQIGAGVVGDPPSAMVRIITLVMLACAAVFAVTEWREQGRSRASANPFRGERMHVVLTLASTSAFAWLVVLGVVLPA